MKTYESVSAINVRTLQQKFVAYEDLLKDLILNKSIDQAKRNKALKVIAAVGIVLCANAAHMHGVDPTEAGKEFARFVTTLVQKPTPEVRQYFSATLGIRGDTNDKDDCGVFKDLAVLFTKWSKKEYS